MNNKRILILGGYGGVGRTLARLMLKELEVDLIIAGRRQKKAEEFVRILIKEFPERRITAEYADASDSISLDKAFRQVDLVVVTATAPDHIHLIASSALKNDCDYLDILVRQDVISALNSFEKEIRDNGRVFISQAGFHPGLPSPFIRKAIPYFDNYQKAIISMAMSAKFEKIESTYEIVHEAQEDSGEILQNGRWRKFSYKDTRLINFGDNFGTRKSFPLQMEEIKSLSDIGIKEMGVYVGGFNFFVDNFVFPLILLLGKIKKGLFMKFLGALLYWGFNNLSSTKDGVVFQLEAEGIKDGRKTQVKIVTGCDDPLLFTAIPIISCIKQYLTYGQLKSGLWLMGNVVNEILLFEDMERMGLKINIETKQGQ